MISIGTDSADPAGAPQPEIHGLVTLLDLMLALSDSRETSRSELRRNFMQTPSTDDDLTVRFYCKDPGSKSSDDCPSFYSTDRGSWVVQGQALGDEVGAQLRGLKPEETFLEVPQALIERFVHMYVEERYGVDLRPASQGTDYPDPRSTEVGAAG
ncbi:hypothetical protein ACWF0M_35495 [Kribbella sp. NPDC055110]